MKRTGVRLRAFAARWFDAAAMERFIDPLLADLQAEYEEAIGRGRIWRARWIWMAGHIGLVKVALWHEGRRLVHGLSGATKRSAATGAMVCALAVTVLATVLQVTPSGVVRESSTPGHLTLLLVPSTLPLSATLGLLAGILVSLRLAPPTVQSCRLVLLGAAMVSLTSFVMFGWIIPEANQAFRVSAFSAAVGHPVLPEAVPKGVNELTLGELRRLLAIELPTSWQSPPADRSDLAFAYHQRWARTSAPTVLSVLALSVAFRWRSRQLPVVCATIAALASYPLIQHTAKVAFDGGLPRGVAAWAANATLLIAAAIVWTRQPSDPASTQPSSA
jgi:hypothetical protein